MALVDELVFWYQKNKRMLPWRQDKNPYHVWISEIMLQQTRIEAVIGYYDRFIKKLPDVASLALIEEDELLKLWQGLGYYNRARNLKKAAIEIMEKYEGNFPKTYEEIKNLPGIGEYTAGAISSICFQEKQTAVDGNVLRVMTRVFSISKNIDQPKVKKEITSMLLEMMPNESGNFNEGLMELGETVCIPNGVPFCQNCPISKYCTSFQNGTMLEYPVRDIKKRVKQEEYTVVILVFENKIAIHKRDQGLLKNLYEFPNYFGKLSKKEIEEKTNGKIKIQMKAYKHVFTHVIWQIQSFVVIVPQMSQKYTWVTLEEIDHVYAIPTAFQPCVREVRRYFEN